MTFLNDTIYAIPKSVFLVRLGKFLGFLIITKCIKVHYDEVKVIIELSSVRTIKEVK